MKSELVPISLILGYFWPQIKKYKTFYIPFIGYGAAFILGGTIKPLFYRDIIDVINSSTDRILVSENVIHLVKMIGIIVLTQNLIHRLTDYAMTYSQSNIMKDLTNFSFAKMLEHSYHFFISNFQGSLVAKNRRFVRSFEALHDNIAFAFWQAVLQLSGIFVVLFMSNSLLGLSFASWCGLFIGLTAFLVHKKRKYDLEVAAADSRTTGGLADATTGVLNIKMFASFEREKERFAEIADKEEKARRIAWNFNNLILIIHSLTWLILEAGGLYLAVRLWLNGSVSAGTIVLTQTYFFTINGIMWNLRGAIGNSMKAISDASEMIQIFEKKPDILDPEDPEPSHIDKGRIEFERVSLAYGENEPVFKDFDLVIDAGSKVGLVGYSGSGKTTITKLILRFVDPFRGRITIDGQDISKIRQDDLRSVTSYVPQEPVLFNRSLRDNIAYGKPTATKDEIIEVAKRANAHEFISKMVHEYETFVGERGIKLSGGERQRIAIARAMLKDSPILILDEATSSLDSISERSVQEATSRLMENRTTIVIAHRLSTVRRMDRIIVLNDGEVAEEGSHEELLQKKGFYYEFWIHQSGGSIE